MTRTVSTAGIKLNEKRGLLDSGPRRFETKDEAELAGESETQASKPKPLSEQKSVQQNNN